LIGVRGHALKFLTLGACSVDATDRRHQAGDRADCGSVGDHTEAVLLPVFAEAVVAGVPAAHILVGARARVV